MDDLQLLDVKLWQNWSKHLRDQLSGDVVSVYGIALASNTTVKNLSGSFDRDLSVNAHGKQGLHFFIYVTFKKSGTSCLKAMQKTGSHKCYLLNRWLQFHLPWPCWCGFFVDLWWSILLLCDSVPLGSRPAYSLYCYFSFKMCFCDKNIWIRLYLLSVNGTTGESMSLTVAERKILAEDWCQKARGKWVNHTGPLSGGVSGNEKSTVCELSCVCVSRQIRSGDRARRLPEP